MNIRYATENDASLLSELGRITFSETFSKDNTPEDIAIHLSNHYTPEIQLAELRDSNSVFLIAETDDKAVGYAKLKGQSTEKGISGTNPIELERIYVLQEYIGKGVGPELIQVSIKEAKERGFDCIWLGVWEKNPRAIRFYKKWGFEQVGMHDFVVGKDVQKDFIMEIAFTD